MKNLKKHFPFARNSLIILKNYELKVEKRKMIQ